VIPPENKIFGISLKSVILQKVLRFILYEPDLK